MRIKVAVLEKDEIYLKRLESVFNVKYSDKIEMYSFTDKDIAIKTLSERKIDVFLADQAYDIDETKLPSSCGFAYLVETADIETIKNTVAICKFQRADLIYRQILGLFSEKASSLIGLLGNQNSSKVIAFVTVSGGTGCSVAAAACAMNFAGKGRNTIYLNLERFGNSDLFFQAEGTHNFGDVIYALKSRKGNLALKIESAVKQDASGVYFYSPAKMALDVAELTQDEILQVLDMLKASGNYDFIILDLDFSLEKKFLKILNNCHSVVFVSDGSQIANAKLERAIASLRVIEQQDDVKILMRSGILYNRFSGQTSRKVQIEELKEFGGINRYEGFTVDKLLAQLKTVQVFAALEQENDRNDI